MFINTCLEFLLQPLGDIQHPPSKLTRLLCSARNFPNTTPIMLTVNEMNHLSPWQAKNAFILYNETYLTGNIDDLILTIQHNHEQVLKMVL